MCHRQLTCAASLSESSQGVARRLLAEGIIAGIKYYPYHGIATALNDLEAGRIGFVIKLFPVISWLVKDRPQLVVAMQVPTHEQLGIAFAKENTALCELSTARSPPCAKVARLRGLRRAGFPSNPD
jgi:polar amino acid transport system substrate-binding protein